MKFQKEASETSSRWFFLLACFLALVPITRSDDSNGNEEVGLTVAEIVRLRRYVAEEHYVTTPDGHILQLVRVLNPLINGGKRGLASKIPLLLVHGLTNSGSVFVANSINARPKDYSSYNAGNMSLADLNALLAYDPVANSIGFLTSNFGHDVWILNRRGTKESLGYVVNGVTSQGANTTVTPEAIAAASSMLSAFGNNTLAKFLSQDLTALAGQFTSTFNPFFWNYSFDEQAKYDIPEVIDYVLNATGSAKLSYVGHSAGGQLILMALINQPGLTNKSLYSGPGLFATLVPVLPILEAYIGPIAPPSVAIASQAALAAACQTKIGQEAICAIIFDTFYGPGGGQHRYTPGLLNQNPSASSSHEWAQLVQGFINRRMYTYDHGNPVGNLLAYGQITPILYDVTRINSTTLSVWYGKQDALISAENVQRLIGDLRVPVTQHFFNVPGLYFNHESFFYHQSASTLVNIPALKTIES